MKILFYPKLAFNGIKKNKRLYFPYLLTCSVMVMMMYITLYLARSESIANTPRGAWAQLCLWLGIIVISLFSLLFLFYSFSVLIKNRSREFGLYNVLGMNKRNIARILLWESIYTLITSILCGLFAGILLSRLAQLCLYKLIGTEPESGLLIDLGAVLITFFIFAVILFLLLLYSFVRIGRLSAVKLLHSEKEGEKAPKGNIFAALIGAVLLCIAYYLSVTTNAGIDAIFIFFIAVILVIAASYLLFISGSVSLCRMLKKNKKYYYRANHFVSVSTMAYRMKKNGAGLASICILSTMVLVMLTSTISLFSGIQTSTLIRSRDISLLIQYGSDKLGDTLTEYCDTALDTVKKNGGEPENLLSYDYLEVGGLYIDGEIIMKPVEVADNASANQIRDIYFITLSDYNRINGLCETLSDGELLIAGEEITGGGIKINGTQYSAKQAPMPQDITYGETIFEVMFVVLPDSKALYDMCLMNNEVYGESASQLTRYYGFDVGVDSAEEERLAGCVENALAEKYRGDERTIFFVEARCKTYDMLVATYGGLLFLGIFLGLVFVFATVLIIYYKQVSEGYEDRDRFATMRSVGMTEREIKKSINSQTLTVFFAPLIAAGVHLAFAFPIIAKTIRMFGFADTPLLLISNIICFAVFALFYIFAYKITSGIYLKIIER